MASKTANLVHVKFDHLSAVETKKDMLASEADLLRISKHLKTYRALRTHELAIKEEAHRKLRSLKLDFGRLLNLLPEVKVPGIVKKAQKMHEKELHPEKIKVKEEVPVEEIEVTKKIQEVKEEPHDELEAELQKIQARLKELA